MIRKLTSVAMLTAYVALPLLAQSTFGDLRGVTRDPSGLPLPSAVVTVHSVDENTDRQVTSAEGGFTVEESETGPISTDRPEGDEKYTVRVPNEKDSVSITQIDVQFPAALQIYGYEPKQGWKVELKKDAKGKISGAVWSGNLGPHEFVEFGLLGINPKASTNMVWKTVQIYGDGNSRGIFRRSRQQASGTSSFHKTDRLFFAALG